MQEEKLIKGEGWKEADTKSCSPGGSENCGSGSGVTLVTFSYKLNAGLLYIAPGGCSCLTYCHIH